MQNIKRLIPNLLTAGNLVGGILAIIFTLTGRIELAPWCIFASAIFDFLDGFAARLLKVQNELGKQLDSLADMVTFGVAPGIMVYAILGFKKGVVNMLSVGSMTAASDYSFLNSIFGAKSFVMENIAFIAFLIPVFALFRLAKFNLDTRQTSSFIGLPTPAMTLFFAVIPILIIKGGDYDFHFWMVTRVILNPDFLVISTIIMSVMMVVELPLFALKFKTFKWKGNEIRFIFLTICVGLFATLLFWSIPLIIILYIILSVINNVIHKTNEI